MRLFKVIALLILYLFSGNSWNLQIHLCGGSLASISLFDNESACVCDAEGRIPCCEDIPVHITQASDDPHVQSSAKLVRAPELKMVSPPVYLTSFYNPDLDQKLGLHALTDPPVLLRDQVPPFILHSSLIFYA